MERVQDCMLSCQPRQLFARLACSRWTSGAASGGERGKKLLTTGVSFHGHAGEPHLEKNDGGIPPRTGTNTMGMRCPGTGSPLPRWALPWVVMPKAVTLHGHPGEPRLEKNDGGIPPRAGTNTMGMRCPGAGSPLPRWALPWGVMPKAVTLHGHGAGLDNPTRFGSTDRTDSPLP